MNKEIVKRAREMAEDQWDNRAMECTDWLIDAINNECSQRAYIVSKMIYLTACYGVLDTRGIDELKELWIEYASDKLYSAAAAEWQEEAEALRDSINEEAQQASLRG